MNRIRKKTPPGPSREEVERAVEILNRHDYAEIRGIFNSVLDAATRGGAGETDMTVVSATFGLWFHEWREFRNHKSYVQRFLKGSENFERMRNRETPIRLKSGKTTIRKPVTEDDVRRVGELAEELKSKAPNKSELDRRIARRLNWPVDQVGLRRVRNLREKAEKQGNQG